jgi:hypothetical protein
VDALTNIKNFIKKFEPKFSKQDPYLEYSAILISVEVFFKEDDVQDVVTREDFRGYQDFLTDGIDHYFCQIWKESYKVHMGFYFVLLRLFQHLIENSVHFKDSFLEPSCVLEDFTRIIGNITKIYKELSSVSDPEVDLDIKDRDALNAYFSNLVYLQRLFLEIVNTLGAPFKGNMSKYEYHVNVYFIDKIT